MSPTITIYDSLPIVSVFIENGLDKEVGIKIKVNRQDSMVGAVLIAYSSFGASEWTTPSILVKESENIIRTLRPGESIAWLPWIFVEAVCEVSPTTGTLNVYLVKSSEDQPKLIDGLAITDTDTHTPTTDPTKILIQKWSR